MVLPDPKLIEACSSYIMNRFGMSRPPALTANILALILTLHDEGLPFPSAEQVSKRMDCTKFGVQASIAVMQPRNMITIEHRDYATYIAPTPELVLAIDSRLPDWYRPRVGFV